MPNFIKYKSTTLEEIIGENYEPLVLLKNAEEEVSTVADQLIRSFIDTEYDPLDIISIFSKYFDWRQVQDTVALLIGEKELRKLKSKE